MLKIICITIIAIAVTSSNLRLPEFRPFSVDVPYFFERGNVDIIGYAIEPYLRGLKRDKRDNSSREERDDDDGNVQHAARHKKKFHDDDDDEAHKSIFKRERIHRESRSQNDNFNDVDEDLEREKKDNRESRRSESKRKDDRAEVDTAAATDDKLHDSDFSPEKGKHPKRTKTSKNKIHKKKSDQTSDTTADHSTSRFLVCGIVGVLVLLGVVIALIYWKSRDNRGYAPIGE